MVYIRLSFVMLTVTVSQQVFADWTFPGYCAQKNSYIRDPNLPVSTRLPPLPVLPKTFQVQVEAQLLDRKVTKTGKIFYDERRKRATVKMFANNQLSTSIFDFDINQTIFVNNGSCYVRDYLTTDQSILIGAKQTGNSTSGTLNFDKANGLLYKGRKTVRDINCDWWQSCIIWPQANFTLDYYFSAYNWSSPSSPRQVPVLAEILGSKYMIPQDVPIHHIYEYFDFRNKIWEDNSVFEVPSGLICPGLPITKTVPNLPQTFSFNEEIISTDGVQSGSVYYDRKAKIIRYLYTSFFSPNLMFVIQDFNTGILFFC
ncbi:uncharacterized protein LOC132734483 [Ruditapes philippinarum]|uniref:uncharacterized protein LOC132734483 n=1 Tax=Ruditapes philippinarum TaxID=129788 RepID=UPI00295B3A45|nr:uncharacterized protein LOC132734483 [Ruditapes philippinarum]